MRKLAKIKGVDANGLAWVNGIIFDVDEDLQDNTNPVAVRSTSRVRFMVGFRQSQIEAFCQIKGWEFITVRRRDVV